MQKRKIVYLFLFLFGIMFLASCEYETIKPETTPVPTVISYSTDIQPIWNKTCTGCHGQGLTAPDLSAGASYNSLINGGLVDTQNPQASIIYTVMASGGSMSAYTNASDANLVLEWIKQGAKNN